MTPSEAAPPWGSILAAIGGGAAAAAIGRLVVDQQILTAEGAQVGLALGGTALAIVGGGKVRVIGASIAAVGVGQLVRGLVEKRTRKIDGPPQNPSQGAAAANANSENAARDSGPALPSAATPRIDWRTDVKITESADGNVTFAGWKTYDDLYLAQWDYFRRTRGADQVANDIIPRTTNGDALQLVDFWRDAAEVNADSGSRPGMVNWDAAVAKWNAATANARREAQGHDVRATYAHNKELWGALDDLSEQLTIGADAATKKQRFADAAKHAILDISENISSAARAVASGTARIATDVAGAIGGIGVALLGPIFAPLTWPLLIVGGLVTVYLLTRSSKQPEEKAIPRMVRRKP